MGAAGLCLSVTQADVTVSVEVLWTSSRLPDTGSLWLRVVAGETNLTHDPLSESHMTFLEALDGQILRSCVCVYKYNGVFKSERWSFSFPLETSRKFRNK